MIKKNINFCIYLKIILPNLFIQSYVLHFLLSPFGAGLKLNFWRFFHGLPVIGAQVKHDFSFESKVAGHEVTGK